MKIKTTITKNYFLVGIFLIIFLSLSNGGYLTSGNISKGNYTTISVSDAKDLIESNDELFILDVRNLYEFVDGHISGAYLIPVSEIEARKGELPKNKSRSILVYCKSGSRSATASSTLDSLGYTQVNNMDGGFIAWMNEEYLFETGPFIKPTTTSNTSELTSGEQTSTSSSTSSTTTPTFELTFMIQVISLLIILKKQRK